VGDPAACADPDEPVGNAINSPSAEKSYPGGRSHRHQEILLRFTVTDTASAYPRQAGLIFQRSRSRRIHTVLRGPSGLTISGQLVE